MGPDHRGPALTQGPEGEAPTLHLRVTDQSDLAQAAPPGGYQGPGGSMEVKAPPIKPREGPAGLMVHRP